AIRLGTEGHVRGWCAHHAGEHRILAGRPGVDRLEHSRSDERLVSVSWLGQERDWGDIMESGALSFVRPAPSPAALPVAKSPADKIRTLDELAGIVGQLQRDVLVVTVTADRFVNKGPGRPVFGEALRAEMLATLEYVGWVAINDAPDAVNAIRKLRPAIYIKGQDYQNPDGDITGKIGMEREAVESCGGRILFTDEVTFSSTELINRHLNVYEPHIRDHLDRQRRDGGLGEILSLIDRVRDMKVLLVGDAIIDEYQYVLPMGKTPKENMIATRYQDREVFAGGVFAAANHVA